MLRVLVKKSLCGHNNTRNTVMTDVLQYLWCAVYVSTTPFSISTYCRCDIRILYPILPNDHYSLLIQGTRVPLGMTKQKYNIFIQAIIHKK